VQVDASGSIVESNEGDNTLSAVATVKKKADLLIMSMVIPDVRQNETGSASVTVKNEGEADVTGAVIKLYKGSSETGTLLGSTTVNVAQGATVTGQISFSLLSAGTQALSAKVDPADVVLEADETNNIANGNAKVGWDKLAIDVGSGSDVPYSQAAGAGYLVPGTVVSSCGTQIEKSYRQAGSAESLTYQIDNLLPGRRYHLDLTFAVCSGDRWINMFVDSKQVYENFAYQVSDSIPALHVTNTLQTVSILLATRQRIERPDSEHY
jgi:subtilase family serine protease